MSEYDKRRLETVKKIHKVTKMILYPAIDIYNGQCVRLTRGEFDKPTVYYKDPLEAAKRWTDLGAHWLHVVDLNGAVEGKPVNIKAIESIMTSVNVPVQIGGGIRTQEVAEIFLTMGAGRIILGSVALEDPDLVQILSYKFENRIALSLDAKEGKVAIHGWKEVSTTDAIELAQHFETMGIASIIYTDISRDGTLTGPNLEATQKMIESVGVPIIVSGGIAKLDDLKKCKEIGAGGVIMGRSLYEGTIDLGEALQL